VTKSRRDVIKDWLDTGALVRLYVELARPGVKLPEQDHGVAALCLDIGWPAALAIPIKDLELGHAGVYGTFSFNRTPFYCEVPYSALLGVQNRQTDEVIAFVPDAGNVQVTAPKVSADGAAPVIDLMSRRTRADADAVRRRLGS
jgi:hypothetical protein